MGVRSLSKKDIREAHRAAMVVALALTRNRSRAEDVVQDAFERVMTTRPWDPAKGSLERHLAGIVRSLVNIAHHAAAPRLEAEAQETLYDEVGRTTGSAEEKMLDAAEVAARDAHAEGELARLGAGVANHAVASGVLRCRAEGMEKSAEIARALDVPIDQVYRANELLSERLRKMREAK